MIKSQLSLIVSTFISGTHIKTFGFPPNYLILASKSPNDLVTANLPGKILIGP